jgi:DNA-directed RNA polymerase subunit RPC12/RpoP
LSENKAKQLWTVIHPEKGVLIACPTCRSIPQTFVQKHCASCGQELIWDNIYLIDTTKKEEVVNENTKQEDHQENIPEDK